MLALQWSKQYRYTYVDVLELIDDGKISSTYRTACLAWHFVLPYFLPGR